jgi:Protein of unknown function (DUF1501)
MNGGVSHMESFDPKPMLSKYGGKTISETPYAEVQDPKKLALERLVVPDGNGNQRNKIFPLQVGFQKHGQSGMEVSDWFPNIARNVDKLAVVRSMYTTDSNHGAQTQFHSGRHMVDGSYPTLGAWVHYGLGSLNDNLPHFISIGTREYWNNKDGHYLGPAHDAVPLRIDPSNPLDFGKPERPFSAEAQGIGLDLVRELNTLRGKEYPADPMLAARIASYELAFRMQRSMPEALDFSKESAETKALYGIDQQHCRDFGSQMLAARRLVERGVRTVDSRRTTRNWRCKSTNPSGRSSPTWSGAGCLRKLWWCSPRNSGVPRARRGRMAGITIFSGSAFGLREVESRGEWSMERPTNWASTPSKTGTTSPMCTPRFCGNSGWTRGSLKFPVGSGSKSTTANRSRKL